MAGSPTSGGRYLLPKAFLYWLPLAFCLTVLAGLVYAAVQQSYRQGANDPQIQMAEDAAAGWDRTAACNCCRLDHCDMARSLAPFLIVYDEAGNVLAASMQLNGSVPAIPPGVLRAAEQSGETS